MSDNQQQPPREQRDIKPHIAKGIASQQKGRLDAARDAYRAALRIDRENPDALHLLGVVEYQRGNIKKSMILVEKSLVVRPDYAPAFESLAKIHIALGNFDDAIKAGQQALSLKQNLHSALLPIAEAYLALDRTEDALTSYQLFDAAIPNNPSTLHNMSVCLMHLGRLDETIALRQRALDLQPEDFDRKYNLAVALNLANRFEDALAIMEKALSSSPENVPALVVAGVSMQALGRLEGALESFELAVSLAPDHAEAHFNLGLVLLTQGDLIRGWEEYSWRKKIDAYKNFKPPLSVPLWEGEDINGKSLLLFPEQGMGDSIHFIRYAALIRDLGATVYCLCPTALFKLFETVDGIEEVIAPGGELLVPDYQVALMELPRIFRTTYDHVPLHNGYLKAPKGLAKWSEEMSIGVVWQGNPSLKNDVNRSVKLSRFDTLLNVNGVRFYSLQVGPGQEQIAALGWQKRITNLAPNLTDYADTANAMTQLDLIITVDTSVAHLAGALGKKVWLLLPANADWRWGREGTTTSWYSSMRLFRQSTFGNWDDVFLEMAHALTDLKERQGS